MKAERAVTIIHALCKDNKHEDATSFLQWYISHLGRIEAPTTNERKLQKKAEKLEREKNIITLENGIEIDTSDGWLLWRGGECPFDNNEIVEVIFRNWSTAVKGLRWLDWKHTNSPRDIIAYRVIKEYED